MALPGLATVMHDATTCPTCAPLVNTDAYRRGAARARRAVAGASPIVNTNPAKQLLEATR